MTHYNEMGKTMLERCHEAIEEKIPEGKRGSSALAAIELETLIENLPSSSSKDLSVRSSQRKDVWELEGPTKREKERLKREQDNEACVDDIIENDNKHDRSVLPSRSMIGGGGTIHRAERTQGKNTDPPPQPGSQRHDPNPKQEDKPTTGSPSKARTYSDPVPAALKTFRELWKGTGAIAPIKTTQALVANKNKILEGEVFTDILGAMMDDMNKQEREKLSANVQGVVKAASEINTSFKNQVKGLEKACNFFQGLGSDLSEEIQECKRLREEAVLRQEMSDVERNELENLQRSNDELIEMFKDVLGSHGKFSHTVAAVSEIIRARDKVRTIRDIIADHKFITVTRENYPKFKLVKKLPEGNKPSGT